MKQKTGRKLLSFLLTLAMVVGLMPGMSLTAYADNTETLLTTITPTGKTTYSETKSGVVTVSHNNDGYSGNYGWLWSTTADTLTVSGCEGYTITKVIFKQNAKSPVTDSSAPFELHFVEVRWVVCQENDDMDGVTSIEVYGYATPAAVEDTTTYTLTIPSTLSVANSGWNATDGISATGTLASGKKLTVTATSANSWALKQQDGSETVGYTMKETSDGSAKTAWEFTALPGSATLGIDVADYSLKPAGTYQDTVTFTAKVEDARKLHSFTLIGPYTGDTLVVEFYEGQTWSDMAAKYSKLRIIRNWIGFGSDGMISKNGRDWVLTTDTVDPNATYTIE